MTCRHSEYRAMLSLFVGIVLVLVLVLVSVVLVLVLVLEPTVLETSLQSSCCKVAAMSPFILKDVCTEIRVLYCSRSTFNKQLDYFVANVGRSRNHSGRVFNL